MKKKKFISFIYFYKEFKIQVIENKMLKAYINDKNKIKGGNYNMGPPGMFPSSGMPSHHYQFI